MAPVNRVVVGQPVDQTKVIRSKELRREMTPAEIVLWEHLRARRLDNLRFRRQQIVRGFIAYFYCHDAGLVVKVDGSIHAEQVGYDADRDALLRQGGFEVIRFANEEVFCSLTSVLTRIAEVCGRRSEDLTPQPPLPQERGSQTVQGEVDAFGHASGFPSPAREGVGG